MREKQGKTVIECSREGKSIEKKGKQGEKINVKTEQIKKDGVAAVERSNGNHGCSYYTVKRMRKVHLQSPETPHHIKHCVGYNKEHF